ncbi:SNF5 [Sanghuangporus sanghuang]
MFVRRQNRLPRNFVWKTRPKAAERRKAGRWVTMISLRLRVRLDDLCLSSSRLERFLSEGGEVVVPLLDVSRYAVRPHRSTTPPVLLAQAQIQTRLEPVTALVPSSQTEETRSATRVGSPWHAARDMNGYTYPPHQHSPTHQQHQQVHQQQQQQSHSSPTSNAGINPAMLQGPTSHPGQTQTQAHLQAQQQAYLARQQQMMAAGGMGGMNAMSAGGGGGGMNGMGANLAGGMANMAGMGMPNGAMNMAAMNNRMNNMAGMNSMNMPGMGGMGNMGGMSGMNNMAGMSGMAGMNNMNMDIFKSGGMGGASVAGAAGNTGMNMGGMGMDGGMTINPAMLGGASGASASNQSGINPAATGAAGGAAGISQQDLQKMMAARQAAINLGGMNNLSNMNAMAGMAGMPGMGVMNGMNMNMNMGMNMMGGNAQQQAMVQQYLAQQQAQQQQQAQHQQQQQQQSQAQAHSPHSATHTPGSAGGGNPYLPFPPQSQAQQQQQQMQVQNANVNPMPPPPPRPSTAMSTSSQHAGMSIGRPPSTIHQHQHQHHQQQQAVMHMQQAQQLQQQQQMGHGSISRPATAAGFRPSSSAGEAPRTPHTPHLANQQNQALSNLQHAAAAHNQNQGRQHVRELSQTPSRPQTAASNHGAGVGAPGMNGKYPLGMSGMGMNNMGGMVNMSGMGGLGMMGGGGMMPPPSLPRQNSLGPTQQTPTPMQSQAQSMQSQQSQHMQQQHPHQQQQQQGGMISAHAHAGSPLSSTGPPGSSSGLTRTPSIGEGLSGIGMGGAPTAGGMDDSMGNMPNMGSMANMSALGMGAAGSGMTNPGMAAGMGMGMGLSSMPGAAGGAGIGVGGIGGGMSQMQHMQEMQHRKQITLAEYHKQQAARLQQQQQHQQATQQASQHQQQQVQQVQQVQGQQGQMANPNAVPGVVSHSPGVSAGMQSAGMNVGGEAQGMGIPNAQVSAMPGAGMNMGMGAMGTPTRPPPSRGSMPPPGSGPMSMGSMGGVGVPAIPSASSGGSTGTVGVAPPTSTSSGASVSTSMNGAIPPTAAGNANATNAAAGTATNSTPTAPNAQQNALAASLPPLPASVQLNPVLTRVSIVPIAESAKKIPPLSQEEIENVSKWLTADKEYEQRYRAMAARAKAELTVGPTGVQRFRWWERDTTPAGQAAAAARRAAGMKMEKFDLVYPHGSPLAAREAAAAAARRKGRRREGLKIPGRLKTPDAEKGEQLVPIRLEFDVEHHKYRDTFVWNLNDPIVTPEAFAMALIDDYGLSTSYHSIITKSIQEQLSDYKAHTATFADVSNDIELSSNGEPKAPLIRGVLEDEGEDAKWWATWRTRLRKKDGTVRKNALLKELAAEIAKSERASRKRKRGAKDTATKEKDKDKEKEKEKEKQDGVAAAKENAVKETKEEDAKEGEESGAKQDAATTTTEEAKPTEATPAAPAPAEANTDVEMREADEDDMHEEMRILIKLDVTVGEMKLDDQFEWDIENSDPTPEQFAEVYCSDLGLAGEFKTAIAHSIREQAAAYQKSLFLVGHPSDGSAIQDDDLRMSFLSPVLSAACSVDQTQAHQPIINYLSDGELDRLDKEREKEANKRRKRNTRGRRGIVLPDREPIRTHRTPAIGFPEIDPSTLAIAAAAAAPTSRRAAAAAASLTIANMVASENGTTVLPPTNPIPAAPALPASKLPKPRGSFKAPSYPSSILKPRANVTSATPSTVVDSSVFQPPIEGDAPLPASVPATPSAPQSKANQGPMTAKRQRELEKEAKEREFADGQRANMINGVWHCSNCGCPDNVAIGRRKGPLGDKSQCGACGKFWHRHRRPRPVEYHTDPEYHLNLRMESDRAKASAKKRGGAAALRALNLQKEQDQAATPASATEEPSSPRPTKSDVWVEIKSSPRKSARQSPAVADALDLERPLSPASDVSSDASERPLARNRGHANGTASVSRPASAVATPAKQESELPAQTEMSTSAPPPSSPGSRPVSAAPNRDSGSAEPSATPAPSGQDTQQPRPVPIQRPQWQEDAMAEMQTRYPDDRFEIILRRTSNLPPEWRVKCLDCPGKLYTPGPGETLSNFEVHLKNRQHRARVQARVQGTTT